MYLKSIVLLVALTALSAKSSIIPLKNVADRHRRSVPSEPQPTPRLCSDLLPCEWHVYDYDPVKGKKTISLNIVNDNCICGPERTCEITEDNLSLSSYILRCRYGNETDVTKLRLRNQT